MADERNADVHEGLDALSDAQIERMKDVVSETDHPYDDPVTGKSNLDVPENEVGVSDASKRAKERAARVERLAVDRPEETVDADQWEDPYMEDR